MKEFGAITWLLFIPLLFILFIFGIFTLFNFTIDISKWEHDSKVANCCIIGIGTCIYYTVVGANWSNIRELL